MRLNKSLMISAIAVRGRSRPRRLQRLGGTERPKTPPVPEEVTEFEAGTTMAALARPARSRSARSSTSRCSAWWMPTATPEGFDVEIAKIIAAELGIPEDGITWIETVSANREPFIQTGRSTSWSRRTRSTTSARKSSPSPGRTTTPGRTSWCSRATPRASTGPEDLEGKPVCTVERLDARRRTSRSTPTR